MMNLRTTVFLIYISLVISTWLRLLWARRVGHNIEASTMIKVPSFLAVQDESFLVDYVLPSPMELLCLS